jgi:hypothetical protein
VIPALGRHIGVTVLVAASILGVWVSMAPAEERAPVAGTYSSMFYNGESGDINGTEVRIVYTRKGYQGTVQISQGEPSQLILIKPTIDDDNHITFEFTDPTFGGRYSYSGRITASGMTGRFAGEEADQTFKRAPSYWDTWRTDPP